MGAHVFESLAIRASDGVEIALYRSLPAARPRGVVQIAHGASEHARRYERLAGVLAEAGYGVYANDHRGHGRTAGSLDRFGIAGPDGWSRIVADQKFLTGHIARAHPGHPIVLLGHSMGSLIAQSYLQAGAEPLRAVVLSGTLSSLPPLPSGGDLAASGGGRHRAAWARRAIRGVRDVVRRVQRAVRGQRAGRGRRPGSSGSAEIRPRCGATSTTPGAACR